jgi:SSS family solute:Na+ symporter
MLVGAVYGLRWSVVGAMLSVIGGEAVLLGFATGLIPQEFQGGCLPLIPALVVVCTILGVDQLMARRSRSSCGPEIGG